MSHPKLIQDPLHGSMEMLPAQCELINTPTFQRLRRLQQLGCSSFVYPGATHTRYAHSLGVAWLARLLLRSLRTHQPEIEITQRDEMLIVLAAQAHDLGHGALSHVFEHWTQQRFGKDHWQHEQKSVQLFRDVWSSGYFGKETDLKSFDVDRIEAFILGTPRDKIDETVLPKHKHWMLDIVNNATNGIDVDKFDYLQRDAHFALGNSEAGLLNVQRIFDMMRVSKDGSCLQFDSKLTDTLHHLFYIRAQMFRSVYQHRNVVAVELMLRDFLDKLFLSSSCTVLRDALISKKENFLIDRYLQIDDTLLQQARIAAASSVPQKDENLQLACSILDAIEQNRLYKCLSSISLSKSEYNALLEIHGDLSSLQWLDSRLQSKLQVTCPLVWTSRAFDSQPLVLHVSHFDHGNGEQNPLEKVQFFSKKRSLSQVRDETRMLPRRWCEYEVKLYSRWHIGSPELRDEIENAFQKSIESVLESKKQSKNQKDGLQIAKVFDEINPVFFESFF